MAVASPRNAIHTVFERVGVYGFGGGSSQKRLKYEIHEEKYYEEEDNMEMVQLGAERTKNVLILMSDTGGGHRASAEAIRDAFQLQFGDEYRVFSLSSVFLLTHHDLWFSDVNTFTFYDPKLKFRNDFVKCLVYGFLNMCGG